MNSLTRRINIFFRLDADGTSVWNEFSGGLTTFMAMAVRVLNNNPRGHGRDH